MRNETVGLEKGASSPLLSLISRSQAWNEETAKHVSAHVEAAAVHIPHVAEPVTAATFAEAVAPEHKEAFAKAIALENPTEKNILRNLARDLHGLKTTAARSSDEISAFKELAKAALGGKEPSAAFTEVSETLLKHPEKAGAFSDAMTAHILDQNTAQLAKIVTPEPLSLVPVVETPLSKPPVATSESAAGKGAAESGAKAGAKSERAWAKLFRNAEGEVHGGKVAAWVGGTAAAGVGIYALTHQQKEEQRRAPSSAAENAR